MKHCLTAILATVLLASPLAAAPDSKKAIAAALADRARPAEDVARDAARKPAALLAFAGVKPGDKVVDFIMGGGYFTRILAKAVGPEGRVYAYQPAEFIAFRAAYGTEQITVASAYLNVTPLKDSMAVFAFPEPVDLIVTAQNYHDMHLAVAPADTAAKTNARLFAALKSGGTLLIIDHAAAPGSGLRDADKLHRIDPAAVRAEVEQAGFKFDGELAVLRNPADPHTQIVFDPAIRGKTDQFVQRYRKPG